MKPDGSNKSLVRSSGGWDPEWSPDGTKIAVTNNAGAGGLDIFTMSADGSDPINITNHPSHEHDPTWQPLPSAYPFSGFFRSVDKPPTMNVVKAGRAVPLKFSLGGDEGLAVFAQGYPISRRISCASSAPLDGIEQILSAGQSALSYDAELDRYTYVWKSKKAWSGTCRQLIMKLDDGSVHRANFKFK